MADKKDNDKKPQKKSVIASLDLKNYKPKYTDPFGNGKPNAVEIDNFLEAEPEYKTDIQSQSSDKSKLIESNAEPKSSTLVNEVKKPKKDEPVEDRVEVKKDENLKSASKVKSNKLQPDEDFEKRVNAEADNDFFDEKPIGIGSTFRAGNVGKPKKVEENADELKADKPERSNRKISLREPVKVNVRHEINDRINQSETDEMTDTIEERKSPRRTETYGIVISAIALIYSLSIADKALVFLSLSLLTYLIRPIAAAPFGKHGQSVQNALKGFSIALFFGAIFFVFF